MSGGWSGGPAAGAPEAVRRLDALVGRWASSGEMVDPETGARTSVAGTDEYEWLAGGWFLLHRVDVTIGGEPVRVLEVIGERDGEGDALLCRAYDDAGGAGLMRAIAAPDGTWRFVGDEMRATLTFAAGGEAMSAAWERLVAGRGWVDWMEMRFERLVAG